MPGPPIDLWVEHHDERAGYVTQLTPEEALEVVQGVVRLCDKGRQVAPVLSGLIRSMVRQRAEPSSVPFARQRRLEITEPALDLWAEQRDELAQLVQWLTPLEALGIVRRIVAECAEVSMVAAALAGMIRGMAERQERNDS